jgi:hypothetical protein
VCLILELLPQSLKTRLYASPPGIAPGQDPPALTMAEVLQCSIDIASGIAYLHDKDKLGADGNAQLPNYDSELANDACTLDAAHQALSLLKRVVHRGG